MTDKLKIVETDKPVTGPLGHVSWPMRYLGTLEVSGDVIDYYVDLDCTTDREAWRPFLHWIEKGGARQACVTTAPCYGFDKENTRFQAGKQLLEEVWWTCFQDDKLVQLGPAHRVIEILKPFMGQV